MNVMHRIAVIAALAVLMSGWGAEAVHAAQPYNPFTGRLIKTASDSAVYYVGADSKRHAFPNAKIYFSWYSSFSNVQVVDDWELALIPLGRNVTYRPASRLVKISDVPEVYAVEPGGVLRNIPSEDVAKALYGPQWATLVDDLDISFFFDYEIGGVIDVVDGRPLYPRGTPVNYQGESFIVDKSTEGTFLLRPITADAWEHNQFAALNRQSVVDADWREFYELGLPVAAAEASYACPACDQASTTPFSFQYGERVSENGKYRLKMPQAWGAAFYAPDLAEPSDILQGIESITGEGATLSVIRYPKQPGETLVSFGQGIREEREADNAYIYADQEHLISFPSHTVVDSRELGGQQVLSWKHLKETESAFYVLSVDVPFERLSSYVEPIHMAIKSFQVLEAVPE